MSRRDLGDRVSSDDRARSLFFAYDGSTFYMSRDGVEEEYRALAVSKESERAWLAELTEQKLAALDQPGNWWTISFLLHHGDFEHSELVLAAAPNGVLWQQCAFLEFLLDYVEKARSRRAISAGRADNATSLARATAQKLLRRSRSDNSRRRIQRIIEKASA